MKKKTIIMLVLAFSLAGCGSASGNKISAVQESQLSSYDIILDVRTPEEFESGHIPDAVNIPNESIGDEEIKELPDKTKRIVVYCKSGKRSAEAAEKLAGLGYTNVTDFGGIDNWDGDIVYSEKTVAGTYCSDDICIDIKEDKTYSISQNNEEIDKGTWVYDKDLILGGKYYFTVLNRTVRFEPGRSETDTDLNGSFIKNAYCEGDTVYMMSGNDFDFKDMGFVSVSVVTATKKDNVQEQKQENDSTIILRDNGRVTNLSTKDGVLSVTTSDGEDEAVVKAVKENGEAKEYKIKYDCNCD